MIHTEQFGRDYSDDGIINYSHTYTGLLNSAKMNGQGSNSNYIHHYQELYQDKRMQTIGIPILKEFINSNNYTRKKLSDNILRKMVLDFIP